MSLEEKSGAKGFFTLTELTTLASNDKTHLSLPKLAGTVPTPRQQSSRAKQGSVIVLASARQGLSKRVGERKQHSRTLVSLEQYDKAAMEEFTVEGQGEKQLARLKRLESSRLVSPEVTLARDLVDEGKHQLNRLMTKRLMAEKKLRELQAQSSLMEMEEMQEIDPTEVLLQLEAELEETLQGLKNENYYEETLAFMIETRRLGLRACKGPILRLKAELSALTQEMAVATKQELEAERNLAIAQRDLQQYSEQYSQEKAQWRSRLNSEVTSYKNKQKLLLFLQKEHEATQEHRRQLGLQRRIWDMEKELNHLREDEQVRLEVKQIEQQGKAEERKFKDIKKTTSITSILDMEPYWRYLMQNKASLEHAVANGQRQIDELTDEREAAKRELSSLVVEPEEASFLSPQEIEYMQERLSAKIRELESSEAHLSHMDELLISVTNSISLIAFDVMNKGDLDVKPSNASSYLEYCTDTLESMLSSLPDFPHQDAHSEGVESPLRPPLPKTYSEQNLTVLGDRQRRKSGRVSRRTSIPEVY